jgi:hypothetical protein
MAVLTPTGLPPPESVTNDPVMVFPYGSVGTPSAPVTDGERVLTPARVLTGAVGKGRHFYVCCVYPCLVYCCLCAPKGREGYDARRTFSVMF